MIVEEIQALQAVVMESAETKRLLTVLHSALQARAHKGGTVTVLPARLEVIPAMALVAATAK